MFENQSLIQKQSSQIFYLLMIGNLQNFKNYFPLASLTLRIIFFYLFFIYILDIDFNLEFIY